MYGVGLKDKISRVSEIHSIYLSSLFRIHARKKIGFSFSAYCLQCYLSLLLGTETGNHSRRKYSDILYFRQGFIFLNICRCLQVIELKNPSVQFWTPGIL